MVSCLLPFYGPHDVSRELIIVANLTYVSISQTYTNRLFLDQLLRNQLIQMRCCRENFMFDINTNPVEMFETENESNHFFKLRLLSMLIRSNYA
jgi:hypothetical protein